MTQVRIGSQLRCPYCHDALVGVGRKAGCESCFAWHHAACLAELGRCGNCGAQAVPPRKERSLEFERARLNELLAKSCTHQGCRSIDTIPIGASYLCKRHAREQSYLMWGLGIALGWGALGVILLALLPTDLGSDAVLVLFFMSAMLAVSAGFALRRGRQVKATLEDAEAADQEQPRSEAPREAPPRVTPSLEARPKASKVTA